MCVPLVLFLSTIVLHSVSAGGVYCAKTARARAAALGLDYPGVHGAPDIHGAVHHGMHHSMMPHRPQPEQLEETEPNVASFTHNPPGEISLDDRIHQEAHPRSLHGSPVQSEHTTDLIFPRGRSVIYHKSNFKEVKHDAPPTLAEAPGQYDLVNRDPQGRNKPLSFVYNEHDLVVDEFVPNRRGMSLSGLPLPQSRGHGAHQRGLTGYGLRREVPVLRSSGINNKGHIRAMTSPSPAVGRWKTIRFPGRLPQPRHGHLNVRQFFSR